MVEGFSFYAVAEISTTPIKHDFTFLVRVPTVLNVYPITVVPKSEVYHIYKIIGFVRIQG